MLTQESCLGYIQLAIEEADISERLHRAYGNRTVKKKREIMSQAVLAVALATRRTEDQGSQMKDGEVRYGVAYAEETHLFRVVLEKTISASDLREKILNDLEGQFFSITPKDAAMAYRAFEKFRKTAKLSRENIENELKLWEVQKDENGRFLYEPFPKEDEIAEQLYTYRDRLAEELPNNNIVKERIIAAKTNLLERYEAYIRKIYGQTEIKRKLCPFIRKKQRGTEA